ncbi:hypothetical protein T492DRAFT_1038843 [Pavlovales sp. CCMP2436]|nr:hypothetical protein T492DRAFT_1038843 [Pavlovales sp. CCMP2436]
MDGEAPDFERSAALRKQVDERMEAAAIRQPVGYLGAQQRVVVSATDMGRAPMAPHYASDVRELQERREDLLRRARAAQLQHESIDLGRAFEDAASRSATVARRSQREGEMATDRALRKVSVLHEDFRARLVEDGVNENATLDDLGLAAADLDAVRRKAVVDEPHNKYAHAMDAARRTRKHKARS